MPPRNTAHESMQSAASKALHTHHTGTSNLPVGAEKQLRKLKKVVLAYTFISKSVPHGSAYKKALDEACVQFHAQMRALPRVLSSQDVQEIQRTLEHIRALTESLVVCGLVKGHIFTFVKRIAVDVLTNIRTRVGESESAGALSTALRGGDANEVYADVATLLDVSHEEDALPVRDPALIYLHTSAPESSQHEQKSPVVRSQIRRSVVRTDTRANIRGTQALTKGQHGGPRVSKEGVMHSAARTREILAFIQKTGTVGIPAVSAAFPQVSSKTVQRALAHLVDSGAVTKTGERRWTQYTAAKSHVDTL